MRVVFDLDGTLIDSAEMIRNSYRDAGAEPPWDFLSLGNHDWIEEARDEVHAKKNAAYLRRLAAAEFSLLPPWRTARALAANGHAVSLLTCAPQGASEALADIFIPWPFRQARSVDSPAEKKKWLANWAGGVYVDDQMHVDDLGMPPGWEFVHYTDQNAYELLEEIL